MLCRRLLSKMLLAVEEKLYFPFQLEKGYFQGKRLFPRKKVISIYHRWAAPTLAGNAHRHHDINEVIASHRLDYAWTRRAVAFEHDLIFHDHAQYVDQIANVERNFQPRAIDGRVE